MEGKAMAVVRSLASAAVFFMLFIQPLSADPSRSNLAETRGLDFDSQQPLGSSLATPSPAGMRLLHDNGGPDGGDGFSHFEGTLIKGEFDRVIVDDLVLSSDSLVGGARICGLWFGSTGCETTFDGFRVRHFR